MSDNPIEDLAKLGIKLTPDLGITPFHRRIVTAVPIPNTRTGCACVLECNHAVTTYGDLSHARGGKVFCQQCHDIAEGC